MSEYKAAIQNEYTVLTASAISMYQRSRVHFFWLVYTHSVYIRVITSFCRHIIKTYPFKVRLKTCIGFLFVTSKETKGNQIPVY
jgi:hypothetical protein